MGAEYSRRNTALLEANDDSSVPHFMNNRSPLLFHQVHGDNVRLSSGHETASREEGFCKGIVFSNRPVAINEHIYVKFVELSTCWSGGLRIGFTATDPSTMRMKLPKYACPCLSNMTGNWAKALEERIVQKKSVLFYYVNQKGEVHYGLDDVEKGIFFSGVTTTGKLWAMMDIYGNTIGIQLLNESYYLRNLKRRSLDVPSFPSLPVIPSRSPLPLNVSYRHQDSLMPMYFHSLHGKHVSLNEERIYAEKNSLYAGHGYVFTEHALKAKDCAILQILSTCDTREESNIIIGLTSCDPGSLSLRDLPDDPDDLLDRPEYWVLNSVNEFANQGDLFMFAITNDGEVQYSKNGSPFVALVYVDHTLDLWLFVNLNQYINKIRSEGVLRDFANCNPEDLVESFRRQLGSANAIENNQERTGPASSSETISECVICYESNINCALYRCGHVCMCYECGKELQRRPDASCPICREEIKDVIKIFK